MKEIPRIDFFKPVLKALVELADSGTNDEINNKVSSLMNIRLLAGVITSRNIAVN